MENSFMPVILSSKFREVLYRINDEISRTILNMENNADFIFAFSLLDITDDNTSLSFITAKKYNDIPRERGNGDLPWTSPSRNIMKAGRVINKIAPFFKQTDVEKWVNAFKAEHKNLINGLKFKIVEGKDIAKFYNGKKYARGNGSLNKSCMRHDACESFMQLYADNPSNIKMVILFEDREHIAGRALLWKLDEPANTWFMDRIYVKEDSDVILFKKFAQKNGWLYKNQQSFDAVNVVQDNIDTYVNMKIKIKGGCDYTRFPYIDTLQFFNKKDNYLTNDETEYQTNPYSIKLREINGNNSGNEFFVEDIIHKDMISIEDAIYCYYGDGYTHKNTAIFLPEYDEYAFPSEVRFSSYQNKLLTVNGSVYSHRLNSFIQSSIAIRVFLDKEMSSYDYYLVEKNNEYVLMGSIAYDSNIIVKSADGTLYFKDDYNAEMEANKLKEQASIVEAIWKSDAIDKLKGVKPKKKPIWK